MSTSTKAIQTIAAPEERGKQMQSDPILREAVHLRLRAVSTDTEGHLGRLVAVHIVLHLLPQTKASDPLVREQRHRAPRVEVARIAVAPQCRACLVYYANYL